VKLQKAAKQQALLKQFSSTSTTGCSCMKT